MRRRIELYIGGKKADLSDQSFILMNYALTDLTKPTIVRNSFSKQITLPGTPTNDAIFGHFRRQDREVGSNIPSEVGSAYTPLKKTSFAIYNELGEIITSGYAKLDAVIANGREETTYKVTLYGGLGSFLYNLNVKEDGTTRGLAGMNYYAEVEGLIEAPKINLGLTISKSLVKQLWDNIDNTSPDTIAKAKAGLINFIPAYNGTPSDDFAADSVLIHKNCRKDGIPPTEEGFSPYENTWVYGKMGQKFNEWQMRDLRSYKQRPCLNVKGFLDALSLPENNGGYTVNWKTRPYDERNLWLTLRTFDTLDYGETGTNNIAPLVSWEREIHFREFEISCPLLGGAGKGTHTVALTIAPKMKANDTLYEAYERRTSGLISPAYNAVFVQVLGYGANGGLIESSDVYVLTNATNISSLTDVANDAQAAMLAHAEDYNTFQPVGSPNYYAIDGKYVPNGNGESVWNNPAQITLQATNLRTVVVVIGRIASTSDYWSPLTPAGLWTSKEQALLGTTQADMIHPEWAADITGTDSYTISAVRSGMTLSQGQVLAGEHSVADYLLSFAKTFGWLLTCDESRKEVTVWSRNAFYNSGEEYDLTHLVDVSQDIEITPLLASTRRYTFSTDAIGGCATRYAKMYSRKYGAYAIDTGYEYEDKENNLADGIVFKTAVPFVGRGKDYSVPLVGTTEYYNWQQYKYTLTYGEKGASLGVSTDYPAVLPTSWDVWNPALSFADIFSKAQFCDDEGKGANGEDCLVYMRPRANWQNALLQYQLTDDLDEMYYFGGDKPCWLCAFGQTLDQVTTLDAGDVPQFRPAADNGNLLLFGVPSELYDPYFLGYDEEKTIYARYWRAYLTDCFNANTRVLKCKVDLTRFQVGPELMRRWWWYEGRWWVLNKISNHSLTTWDATECEFVQVQDTAAYKFGQVLDETPGGGGGGGDIPTPEPIEE